MNSFKAVEGSGRQMAGESSSDAGRHRLKPALFCWGSGIALRTTPGLPLFYPSWSAGVCDLALPFGGLSL
jgi:hypothetical protein